MIALPELLGNLKGLRSHFVCFKLKNASESWPAEERHKWMCSYSSMESSEWTVGPHESLFQVALLPVRLTYSGWASACEMVMKYVKIGFRV